MSDVSAKQQIVDKIKSSTNILVTVSNNPSVDELSAALGLSLLLNKMKKHATAVFSGETPAAINFLDPEKTFENTVDSLRDFIIALDKEKADHLRYKVEGDVVKIFITPYRTTITSDDLDFSQGDYNVELVLALGVKRQDSLDKALEAHGQIFDDATVATIVAGSDTSDLGTITWRDNSASSLSEMMVGLSETLKADKPVIDEQIATAFLAGIVAATERFSNNRTSARVMTMAAQLMGAGANQQLIASKFEEAIDADEAVPQQQDPAPAASVEPPTEAPEALPAEEDAAANNDGTMSLSEGESTKVERAVSEEESVAPSEPEVNDDGSLSISHEKGGTLDEVAQQTAMEDQAAATEAAERAVSAVQPVAEAEQELADVLPLVVAPTPTISAEDLQKDIEAASAAVDAAAETPQLQGAVSSDVWKNASAPVYGGTLNATTEEAAEAARKLEIDNQQKVILNHSGEYIANQTPIFDVPLINAASQAAEEQSIVNPLHDPGGPTLMAPPLQPISQPAAAFDEQGLAPEMPGLPPLPDFSTLPPLPPMPPAGFDGGALPVEQAAPAPVAAVVNDPGQFHIPGQG